MKRIRFNAAAFPLVMLLFIRQFAYTSRIRACPSLSGCGALLPRTDRQHGVHASAITRVKYTTAEKKVKVSGPHSFMEGF